MIATVQKKLLALQMQLSHAWKGQSISLHRPSISKALAHKAVSAF